MRSLLAQAFFLLAGVVGCGRPQGELLNPSGPPIVWPKAPDAPRVRYLGQLRGADDLRPPKSAWQFWQEVIHGPAEPPRLITPQAVAVHPDGQRVAVADTNGACVHVFDLARRRHELKIACGTGGQRLACPVAVAWAGDTLWVADSKLHALVRFPAEGPGRILGREVLRRPAGLAFCQLNGLCYVTDAALHAVMLFDDQGRQVAQFGSQGAGPGQFNYPSHVSCAADGTVVVADSLNFRVQRFSPDGALGGVFGRKGDAAGDLALPKGVAVDPEGNVWVVDAHFENVQAFTAAGELLMSFGGEGQGPGEFWLPAGIFIDARRRIWVADTYNRRVQVFELHG